MQWCDDLDIACRSADFATFDQAIDLLRTIRPEGQLHFIGNGGSAAIASHMAVDFMNKGGFNARCLNDPAALTCIANDYGYEAVFYLQLERCMRAGDVLVAISSSGASRNILNAAKTAEYRNVAVMTLTGFDPSNLLRQIGKINFHVPSRNYGIVETAHLGVLHALLEAVTP